jgi:hypothetical protein
VGGYRWFSRWDIPAVDEEGKIIKGYGTATDIHDQNCLEEELIDREERLGYKLKSFFSLSTNYLNHIV